MEFISVQLSFFKSPFFIFVPAESLILDIIIDVIISPNVLL